MLPPCLTDFPPVEKFIKTLAIKGLPLRALDSLPLEVPDGMYHVGDLNGVSTINSCLRNKKETYDDSDYLISASKNYPHSNGDQ